MLICSCIFFYGVIEAIYVIIYIHIFWETHIYIGRRNPHFLPFLIIWNDSPINIFSTVSYSWPFFMLLWLLQVGLQLQEETRGQQSPAANPIVGGRKLHKLLAIAGLLHEGLPQGWGSINITCKESNNNMTFYKIKIIKKMELMKKVIWPFISILNHLFLDRIENYIDFI